MNTNNQFGIFCNRNHPELNYGETGYLVGGLFYPDSERNDYLCNEGFIINKNDFYTSDMTYVNGMESKTKY